MEMTKITINLLSKKDVEENVEINKLLLQKIEHFSFVA